VSWSRLRAVALATLAAGAMSIASVPAASAAVTPKSALIYGDSLTYESQWAIAGRFATKAGWVQHAHEFPGFALCDLLAWLPADLAAYHPSVVAVETAGNYARPCVVDANGNQLDPTSAAFFVKYRADIHAFFKAVTDTGATVVWISAPPMLDAAWDSRIVKLNSIATEVAASYPGVSVSATPRNQVSNAGVYTATKPCLASETAALGCGLPGAGLIWVRTVTGPQTGIHFCPAGLDVYPYPCLPTAGTTYASGEYRWGTAVADATVAPPASLRPTVVMASVAGIEGSTLAFKPTLLWPYSRDLTLCYSTVDGTATAAADDYTAASGCFTIPAWTTTGPTLAVSTLRDGVPETTNETLQLKVWGWTAPITGNTKFATGTIKPLPPDAPSVTAVSATAGKINVTWAPPVFAGDAPITGYQATCASSNGGITRVSALGLTNPAMVTSLSPGKTYTCTAVAKNAYGTSPASAPSAPIVTPRVPDVPTGVTVSLIPATSGKVVVTFTSNFDGGAPITGYQATCSSADGGTKRTSTLTLTTSLTVASLTLAKTYTCTVSAKNAVGASPPSNPSPAITT
jgi:hypothetical protein